MDYIVYKCLVRGLKLMLDELAHYGVEIKFGEEFYFTLHEKAK